ncbi:MAG: cupin-like domain-containing protein, partial [Sphingomicrobium sp.]
MLPDLPNIMELADATPERFRAHVQANNSPVILRGVARDWPVVDACSRSDREVLAYLARFDSGELVSTLVAPPEARGRFNYQSDMTGFNFSKHSLPLREVFGALLGEATKAHPPAIAMQAINASKQFPGLTTEISMPFVPEGVAPKLWIGNAATVAPHGDLYNNIACVAAGRRRFTLFPPDQLRNMYVGPIDLTPAGTPVSMVSVQNPDFDRFPRFREALAHAQVAELAPGDAIYIPYMWWHGVEALSSLNVLVNFWWNEHTPVHGHPLNALVLASLVFRDLPEEHRQIWRQFFDYYVFAIGEPPIAHLPPTQRGIMGSIDEQ